MSEYKTNTNLHLSDKADSVFIDKEGTVWENNESVETVQDALETIQEQSISVIKATDEVYGVVRLANENDLSNYVGTGDVVTSKQMFDYNSKPEATYKSIGTTQYASSSEVMSGKLDNRSVTPKELQYKFDNHNSTVDTYGTIKLAHESMVIPGVNNDTAMTPLLTKYAIDNLVPEIAIATEEVTGTVTLADINATLDGNIRIGYAVSPWSFNRANATESKIGTVQIATVSQARQGTARDKYVISPYTFKNARATTTNVGTVQLATESEVKAKSNNDKAVTPLSLKYYSDLIENLNKKLNELESRVKEINDYNVTPIGMLGLFTKNSAPKGWLLADGRSFNISEYPELYKYLGSSVVPDYTGYFLRGYDPNNRRDPNGSSRSIGSHQGDAIRNITGRFGADFGRNYIAEGTFYVTSTRHGKTGDGSDSGVYTFDASRVVPTSSENRPVNKTVAIYIRAKNY